MPSNRVFRTQLLIIGGGIAGYSLAYEAAKLKIESLVLDNGRRGTTHAATGILDARIDHLLRDIDSVEGTAREVAEWRNNFPYGRPVIKPRHFLMPIGPDTPHSVFAFDALFDIYEKVARVRLHGLPAKHRFLSPAIIEKMMPNLRKNHFESFLSFWLWTVDPDILLGKVRNEAIMFSPYAKRLIIKKILGFNVANSHIEGISVEDYEGRQIKVAGHGPLAVINSSGPWIGETVKGLGIKFPIKLSMGVQAKFPGYYFNSDSGVITFGKDGKYVICLQEKGYLQVGPTTSSNFSGPLNNPEISDNNLAYLAETLGSLVDEVIYPPELLKYGWRVKPEYFFDTDRPMIWHHQKDGFINLYTAVPGKMALGLLMTRELLARIYSDGWFKKSVQIPSGKTLSLDGNKPFYNQIKLLRLYLKSHLILGIQFIKKALAFR